MVYTINQIQSIVTPIFEAQGIIKAVLFGSYAKGEADEQSDIDLCVDSKGELQGFDFIDLIEQVREKLGKEVDVIDTTHIDKGSKVESEIRSTGVVIYEG